MRVRSQLIRTALLTWAIMSLLPRGGRAQQSTTPKRVLVLYWYGKDDLRNILFDQRFQAVLKSAPAGTIEYYAEYLETNRFPGENQSLLLRDYLRKKYADRTIDVAVARTSVALDFLFKYRDDLFPHTPIVFTAIKRPTARQIGSGPGATGIIYSNTHRKTLDLALRLHPATEQVFVITGNKDFETVAREELQRYESRVQITYLNDLPLDELILKVKSLPERSIVLYVWQQLHNPQSKIIEASEVLALIAQSTRVPIYGMASGYIGGGIIGGYVYTEEANATRVAEMSLQVAGGAREQDIPVENAPSVPMFDWRQLRRWGISEESLPPGSIIRFREPTAWQQYKGRIIVAIGICGLQSILIGALLIERRRVRKANAALRAAQRVTQESEERFRNMADTAPVMIWVAGPDKLHTFFSKGWLTFTGRTMEQELGIGWTESVHRDDLDHCSAIYSSSFDARRAFQKEYRLRRADGEYRWVVSIGVPRFQQGGEFAGYIGSCLDITELKRTQEKALAGQKLESMGLMASGIAHDFNNLLGGILASTELALTEYAEGFPHEDELMRIRSVAVAGAEIVRELMLYGGRQSPAFEPVDVSRLVGEMLCLLKVSISRYAVLKSELGTELPRVLANPAQIRQVVMNLVINASQAIGEREGNIWVTTALVTAKSAATAIVANLPEDDYLRLEVSDTGCGMTEEERIKIFDPFFTTKPAGRGLGLAVVQGVVRAHGGAINVVSAPGQGTLFQILLPCNKRKAMEVRSVIAPRVADHVLSQAGTILMVEDEDSIRVAVSKTLRKGGFSVIEAADGKTGVDLFRTKAAEIDVVLLDMSLPRKSGREVLGELLGIQRGVKVILTSAYGQDKVLNSLGGLQPWAYIQKPYRVDDLVNLLRGHAPEAPPVGSPKLARTARDVT